MGATVLLVVEDDFFLRNLAENLKHLKASVLTAASQYEALEVCANYEVDLALLDIRRQGREAMQVLARLKKNQPETEVILLSDQENIGLAMEGMQQGASDDIIVPFDIDSLVKKIRSGLKRRKARARASRKGGLFNAFGEAMVAATFAQAGEFETARELSGNGGQNSAAAEKAKPGHKNNPGDDKFYGY